MMLYGACLFPAWLLGLLLLALWPWLVLLAGIAWCAIQLYYVRRERRRVP